MVDIVSLVVAIFSILIAGIALILIFVRSGSNSTGPPGPTGPTGPIGPTGSQGHTGTNASQTFSNVVYIDENSGNIPALDGSLYTISADQGSIYTLGFSGQILTPGTSVTIANPTDNSYILQNPFCDFTTGEVSRSYVINGYSINTIVAAEPGQCLEAPNLSSTLLLGVTYEFD